MTVSLRKTSKFSIMGFTRKPKAREFMPKREQSGPEEIAKLFASDRKPDLAKTVKPRELNDTELNDRDTICGLRGALYAKK